MADEFVMRLSNSVWTGRVFTANEGWAKRALFSRVPTRTAQGDVPLKVSAVPVRMLPIAPLPQASLALRDLVQCAPDIDGQSSRKAALDQAPAQRKIAMLLSFMGLPRFHYSY